MSVISVCFILVFGVWGFIFSITSFVCGSVLLVPLIVGLVLFWVLMAALHGVNWTHVSFGICAYLFSGLLKVSVVRGGVRFFSLNGYFVIVSKRAPCRFLDVIGLCA